MRRIGQKSLWWMVPVLALAIAACSAVFRTQATQKVEEINPNLTDLIRAKAEADVATQSSMQEAYRAHRDQIAQTEPLIASAYTETFGQGFRFVADHNLDDDHAALMDALDNSLNEGLHPDNFLTTDLKAHAEKIASSQAAVSSAAQVTLTEEQKQALVAHMTEESKKDAAPELNGTAILDWMLKPEFGAKYPSVHQAFDNTKKAVLERAVSEYAVELGDAAAYFKYIRAMGLKDDMLLPNWQKSVTDIKAALAESVPNTPHYLRLRGELDRYRKLAKKHPDLTKLSVGASAKIKVGASGDLVKSVQERLEMTGYYTGPISGTFDESTKSALTQYQENHQVVPDGIIGKGTIDAMNVPFDDRVRHIRLAMSKQRLSPTRWESYYLRVNIPEFVVEAVEDGKILRKHKVIVGNLSAINHTPEFTATIKKIVYNPAWFITPRIFKLEELPKWQGDEEYFTKKGYKAHFNKEGVPVAAYQPPGPGNALGRVKILFPNKHDVYLHDTPTKPLFNRTIRAFSHGCIRLQNPLDMAEFLLKKDGNPAAEEIDNILAKFATREIDLQKEVPIFIEYSTVSTTEDGRAVFLGDIYKRDTDALAELDKPI